MRYKMFGNTGMPVSEIILGGANLGTRKGYGASADEIPKILSAFSEAGGNFIDLADQYQLGEAEEIAGRFIRPKRQDFVICSKYTRSNKRSPSPANEGNHRKVMVSAVESSLKRLNTDYIDIYMPHYDDGRTPLEEIARGLEDLIRSGKIIYAGLANFPAWKASSIAGQVPVSALQIEYNLLQRQADHELIPMSDYFNMGIMAYGPLAGGLLTGKYREGQQGRLTTSDPEAMQESEKTKQIVDSLAIIAGQLNATIGQVALSWLLTKDLFPIIGVRTSGHIDESLGALNIHLDNEQIRILDELSAVNLQYPHHLLKAVQRKFPI